jgi:hypothetical protein
MPSHINSLTGQLNAGGYYGFKLHAVFPAFKWVSTKGIGANDVSTGTEIGTMHSQHILGAL